jgi:hypothetical protein
LVKGATWEYRVAKESVIRRGPEERKIEKPGTVVDRCLGPSADEPGIQLLERRIEEHNPTFAVPIIVTTVQRLSVTSDSISALSIQQWGHELVPYDVPQPLFSFSTSDQRFTQNVEGLHFDVAPVALSTESVSVPAGDYPDALKRVVSGSVQGRLARAPVLRGSVVESTWFARGVGPVKVERTLEMEIRVGRKLANATEVTVRVLVRCRMRSDVETAVETYIRAASERDPQARAALLEACFADEVRFVARSREIRGRAAVAEEIARLLADPQFSRIRIASVIDAGDSSFRFRSVVERRDGVSHEFFDAGMVDETGRISLVLTFAGPLAQAADE